MNSHFFKEDIQIAINHMKRGLTSLIIQFSSVVQSCPTLCDPMGCSTPGSPVHHQRPEFTQTHLYLQSPSKPMSIVSVMPSKHLILCHPLLLLQSFQASGSFPMSQLFASGGQSIGVSALASVFPMNIQY